MKCVLSTKKICKFENVKACLSYFTLLALAILTGGFQIYTRKASGIRLCVIIYYFI